MKSAVLALVFCLAVAFGAVVDLTPDNFDSVVDGSKNVFVEFFAPWCGHCKNLAPEYEVVGETFGKESSVVIAKVDADAHSSLGSRFGVTGFPTLKFFPKGSTEPEAYEGGRTADDIVNYVNNKAGTNARVKKAPSAVVELDSSNFDSIVLDSSKDVLVEFYAPWCGHCKKLVPDYEKVARIFANDDDVIIAKIDADGNKGPGSKYGVTGFPTIKWFGKSNKEEPLAYDSARDVQSFVDFVNNHAGTRRTLEGTLSEDAGLVAALGDIAKSFVKSTTKDALIKQAEEIVNGLEGEDQKNGKFYVKVMNAIKSKGEKFIETEPSRLDRMLEGGSVKGSKVDEFTIRKNIISSFDDE